MPLRSRSGNPTTSGVLGSDGLSWGFFSVSAHKHFSFSLPVSCQLAVLGHWPDLVVVVVVVVSPWVLWTIENVTEFSSKLILQLSVACSSLQWSWRRFLLLMQEPHVRYLCLRLNHKKNVLFPRWGYKCLGGVCPHCCGQPSGFNQDKFDCRPEDDYCRQSSCKDYSLTEQPIMQGH